MTPTCLFTLRVKLFPPAKCSNSSKFKFSMGLLPPSPSSFPRWHLAPGAGFPAPTTRSKRVTRAHGVPLSWALPQRAGLVSGPHEGATGLLDPLSYTAYPLLSVTPRRPPIIRSLLLSASPVDPGLQLWLSTQLFNISSPEHMGTTGSPHSMHRLWCLT